MRNAVMAADTSTITTLLLEDLPAELNKRETLLEHFSQFGEVTRVQCRNDRTAIVHFKCHGDAVAAKNKGKKVSQLFPPVSIQWCKMKRQTSSEGSATSKLPKLTTSQKNPFQLTGMTFPHTSTSTVSHPSGILFGKPVSTTSVAPPTSSSAPITFFGKSSSFVTTSTVEPAAKMGPVSKPCMLFGKPIISDVAKKPNSTQEHKGTVSDKLSVESTSLSPAFKPKTGQFPLNSHPFSPMRWSADLASKDPTPRTVSAQKQDALRQRGNLVWTKEKAAIAPSRAPSDGSKKGPDLAAFAVEPREVTAALGTSRQLNVVTRSHTQTSSLSKFAELFAHAAHSVNDRYKVLDAKDKIIREQISSEQQEGPIKGTCTDMCPEKERYHRSLRNLVEKFEMLPGAEGVMDHTRMVKEYQRSSADQEFPLPHELRPPPVLKMTMNYLIREIIANQPSKAVGDWFTFVWNRTRAIRKDITQQEIEADPISALILERCARFHIHCAHSLCEEDHHDFDLKLNNENLTKCLKSLKYSYDDLRVQKIRCPNEAEFVAYDILLNLKEGNIAKMITDLEPELRRDPLVKLAISAMNAIGGGNYRRFFKIVRQAPYLVACILHRYFIEVRRHAFRVLAKSLSSKGGDMTLASLATDLFFNSEDDCARFLTVLNIQADEHGFVNFKTINDYDDARFDMCKSQDIVQKMGTSLAQVVHGPGNIPIDIYQPQDSFTADGMLKKSIAGLPETFKIREPPSTVFTPPPELPKPRELRDEDLQAALTFIVEYVLHEQVNAICHGAIEEHCACLANLERVIKEVINEEVSDVANEINEQEVKADQLRKRALLSKIAHDESNELMLKYSSRFLRELCEEALAEVSLEAVAELAQESQTSILNRALVEMVSDIVSSEYESVLDEHHKSLANDFRTMALCKKVIRQWKKWVLLQKDIRNFPAAPNLGPQKRYPNAGKSSGTRLRIEQARLTELRLLAGITSIVDTLPLNIPQIFRKRVRILVVGDASKPIMNKLKKLLSYDSTVTYRVDPPESVQGFNVVVVLPNDSPIIASSIAALGQHVTPRPAIGILWCGHPMLLAPDVEEELLQKDYEPICIPLCNLLKKLSRRLPEDIKLERATLPDFVNRGIESCLDKVSAPCNYLPVAVRLYNEIIIHLAAVATSSTLLQVNSLDDEMTWNSKDHFNNLYRQIMHLELPVPQSSDRIAFVESVQQVKNISLLTTAVNMADFKDDLVLLRDIHAQLNYILNPNFKVRYLLDDLQKFEVPNFWYKRPMVLPLKSVTPVELVGSTGFGRDQNDGEAKNHQERLEITIRSAREVLRRSELSYRRKVLEFHDMQKLKKPLGNPEVFPEVPRKRHRNDNTKEPSTKTFSTVSDTLKRLSPGRLSRQTQMELDIFELRRTIETYKNKIRVNKLLKDA
ncbi:hypothetical protein BIW11_01223 [Tropilaelaps mercedesae]|uniref:PCI domain-containing protein n=1 Tax=Tropilaelaps mercedesae TaxID=418985 RepID=A0A1V9XH70_9ACAR|nr:hypothetical protein BIW11_01223 [Tropilaelaps mercedesae]